MLRFAIVIRLFLRMIQVSAAEKPETLGSQCHRMILVDYEHEGELAEQLF